MTTTLKTSAKVSGIWPQKVQIGYAVQKRNIKIKTPIEHVRYIIALHQTSPSVSDVNIGCLSFLQLLAPGEDSASMVFCTSRLAAISKSA